MYIGHYGVAFALKKKNKQIPLWIMFLAVQFSDLLAFILILPGVERISYVGGINPFYRTAIEYLPYSHSLLMNMIFAIAVFLIFRKLKDRIWGLVLSGALLSHWVIDFIFQKDNMPLIFDRYKVGLGLWDYPVFSFLTEVIFIIITIFILYSDKNLKLKNGRLFILGLLMILYFSFVMLVPEPPIIQTSPRLKALVILIPYMLFTLISYFIDKEQISNVKMIEQSVLKAPDI